MTEKEPTQEQIREFWEWCGFRFKLSASENPHYWIDSYGRALSKLPKADLNNLFKYALPKLQNCILSTSLNGGYLCNLYFDGKWSGSSRNNDPALALFWAIWEVVKK